MTKLPPYRSPKRLPERAFHYAQMVLPQDPKPINPAARLLVDITTVEVPGMVDGSLPLARGGLHLPGGGRTRPIISEGPGGLQVPWGHHPILPALLLPGPVVTDLRWQGRWRVSHFVSPLTAELPFSREALAVASWHAIANIRPRKAAIAELAYLASQLDGLGYGSSREVAFLDQMGLPDQLRQRIHSELGEMKPLLDPRCLRWIVSEMCAVLSLDRPAALPPLTAEAREVIAAFLPMLGRNGIPFRRELYRAVWFLHDSFSLGSRHLDPTSEAGDDDLLTVTAAHTAGVRLYDDLDDQLLRAAEMLTIADDDPFIGAQVRPSAIRDAFQTVSALEVPEFLAVALLEVWAIRAGFHGREEAAQAARQLQAHLASPAKRLRFVATVRQEMTLSPRKLGRRVLEEMRRYGQEYTGWGSVPQHASEALRDRPVLDLPGVLLPMGQGLFLARAAELPVAVYQRRSGLRRKEVRGQVGRLFEARLQRRVEELRRTRCWAATGPEIDAVVSDNAKRPDVILGSPDHRYLMVEINASRLETGPAAGNLRSVENLVDIYIRKRGQADALIADAQAVIGRLLGTDHARVASAIPLVVADEPLPSNPAFERAVRSREPDGSPRFVCSVGEFELLLDLAEVGWDAPKLVERWQETGDGQMLGTFLRAQAHMSPRPQDAADRLSALFNELAA